MTSDLTSSGNEGILGFITPCTPPPQLSSDLNAVFMPLGLGYSTPPHCIVKDCLQYEHRATLPIPSLAQQQQHYAKYHPEVLSLLAAQSKQTLNFLDWHLCPLHCGTICLGTTNLTTHQQRCNNKRSPSTRGLKQQQHGHSAPASVTVALPSSTTDASQLTQSTTTTTTTHPNKTPATATHAQQPTLATTEAVSTKYKIALYVCPTHHRDAFEQKLKSAYNTITVTEAICEATTLAFHTTHQPAPSPL